MSWLGDINRWLIDKKILSYKHKPNTKFEWIFFLIPFAVFIVGGAVFMVGAVFITIFLEIFKLFQ